MNMLLEPSRSDGAASLGRLHATPSLAGRADVRSLRAGGAAAIIPIGISVIWLTAASNHVEHSVATALYRTYLAVAPLLIGVYWCHRRPWSRFGPLLIAFGLVTWIMSWQASDRPLIFD